MNIHLKIAESLTELLENRFQLFGFRFGLDPLIGIIPGIGDIISAALSLYLVWVAVRMEIPDDKVRKMIQNVIADFVIGLIPVIGDATDFVYKANTRNMEILRQYKKPEIVEGEIIG